jgi:hypothetical protein
MDVGDELHKVISSVIIRITANTQSRADSSFHGQLQMALDAGGLHTE